MLYSDHLKGQAMICKEFNNIKYPKTRNILLASGLFSTLCSELEKVFNGMFNEAYQNDFAFGTPLISSILKDILSSEHYTLSGISYYTQIQKDVLIDIITYSNRNPSFELSIRIIDLDMSVRKDLYKNILNKFKKK